MELENLFSLLRYGSAKLHGFGDYRETYREIYRKYMWKIALSRIFDICLDCPNFDNYCTIFANYCTIMEQMGQNLGKWGKYQKSGSEWFFVILRRVTGPNLVLFRWTSEAVKQFLWKKCVFFTYISYIFPYTLPDNHQNDATLPIHISTTRKDFLIP